MKKLKEILPPEVLECSGNLDVPVNGLTYDSRQVKPGFLFIALSGSNADGHKFIGEAVSRGAIGAIIQDPVDSFPIPLVRVSDSRKALSKIAASYFDYPAERSTLIGVTGTKGKTTTTYLAQSILKEAYGQAFRFGTVEYDLGFAVKPAKNTTPESFDLMSLLSESIAGGSNTGIMEVSSHALKIGRVADLSFAAAGFSNLSMEHTEFHPDMEDYYQAKRRLFFDLLAKGKAAVIGVDDEYGVRLAKECREAEIKVVTVGIGSPEADFHAEDPEISASGSSFSLVAEGKRRKCRIGLPGKFNIFNSLLAAALCRAIGAEWKKIIRGIEALHRVPGRFEAVPNKLGLTVIVDYAHSPASLENVLHAIRPLSQRRVITVFGCGGNRSHEKRPVMGRLAVELSDVTIVTSDNPRKEKPDEIISQIMSGVNSFPDKKNKEVHVEVDRKKAIGMAVGMAKPGDIVLIAGKGHESGQTFADRTISFDDRLVAMEFLEDPAGE